MYPSPTAYHTKGENCYIPYWVNVLGDRFNYTEPVPEKAVLPDYCHILPAYKLNVKNLGIFILNS